MAITFFGGVVSSGSTSEPGPLSVTPPASMLSGDLAVFIGTTADVTGTMSVSTTGGQTWNATAQYSTTNNRVRIFWCQFNGTWSANPALSTSGGVQDFAIGLYVWRPSVSSDTWVLDTGPSSATFTAPGSAPGAVTNTGITTTNTNTVVLSLWTVTGALPNWSSPSSGWSQPSPTGFSAFPNRWTDTGLSYKVMTSAGSSGNPSLTEDTNTAGIGSVTAWAETSGGGGSTIVVPNQPVIGVGIY